MPKIDPIPQAEPITLDAQQQPLYINGRWLTWFYNAITVVLGLARTRLGSVLRLTNQNASIGATALSLPSLSAGRYAISWYARVTTPDGVSSSLTVSIRWTESAVSLFVSGAAITGDSPTSVQTGTVFAEVDGNSAISYSTTYASNTPGAMKYRLSIEVEALP